MDLLVSQQLRNNRQSPVQLQNVVQLRRMQCLITNALPSKVAQALHDVCHQKLFTIHPTSSKRGLLQQ
jgi:hypothetical protein